MKIEVRNLMKTYKKKEALSGLTFTIEGPKIYGFLGHNGAGKTTFLNILSGLIAETSGELLVNGERVFDNTKVLQSICFISEGNNFKRDLTIHSVLKMNAYLNPKWDAELAEKLLIDFSLNKRDKIKNLSKGMESALGIIIGFASRAPITIFDEPYIGLDAAARNHFYELLIDQFEIEPRMFILSTHLIDEVSDLFEEVIILQKGKAIIQSDAESLRENCVSVSGPKELVEMYVKEKNVLKRKPFMNQETAILIDQVTDASENPQLVIEHIRLQEVMIHLSEMKGAV